MNRNRLCDDQWARIESLLPGKPTDPGRTAGDNRLFVEAVLWMARAGAPWRDLPPRFGRWNSVYSRFARLTDRGVWRAIFSELARDGDLEELYLDSTIVRAHQRAAGAPKKRGPSHWALARRLDDEDSRSGRGAGQPGRVDVDRRPSSRLHSGLPSA